MANGVEVDARGGTAAPPAPAAPPELPPPVRRPARSSLQPATPEPDGSRSRVATIVWWLVFTAIAAAVVAVYLNYVRPVPMPDGLIVASGRIEGDETLIAGRRAGRIQRLLLREGDVVHAGQLLAQLEDVELDARRDLARARVRQSAAMVAASDAGLSRAEAALAQADTDAARFGELSARGTVSKLQGEHARLASTTAEHDVAVARALRLQALEGAAQARAALAEVESTMRDQTVVAPTAGTVTTRVRSEGEVVAAGAPLAVIVDLDRLYLQVYVPEPEIGKLRLGLPARVYTDAFPDHPFAATVRQIASRAEFTPKEVQTSDERVKLVFAVKLYLDENPDHALAPGMPADAVIRWKPDAPWTPPRF